MSETSAHGAIQSIHNLNYGSIGESLDQQTQTRLKSIPEMGYLISDERIVDLGGRQQKVTCPRGELMVRGPSVFSGYFNDEKRTQDSFEDGWFLTGDVAEYNSVTKEMRLIDRKRGIMKLSQGEFISINQIEDAISKSKLVESVFLYANRFQSITVAVVNVNRVNFRLKGFLDDQLALNAGAIQAITADVKKICRDLQLKSFEIPRIIVIEDEPWTPDNGLLTPGLKIKRPACNEKYERTCLEIIAKIGKNPKMTPQEEAEMAVTVLIEGANGKYEELASNYTGMR